MFSIHCNSRFKSWKNRKRPQRIIKIKLFVDKYNCEETSCQPEIDDWKNFRKII